MGTTTFFRNAHSPDTEGKKGTTRVRVHVLIENKVKLHGHEMKHVAKTIGSETKVTSFTPYEKVERNVEQLTPKVVVVLVFAGKGHVGFEAEEGAPGGVVAEELAAEAGDDGGVEGGGGGRSVVVKAGVGVGEVEKEVLPLVGDVVVLEAEEEGEPVEEVLVAWVPRDERVSREAFHVAEDGGGG